MECDRELFSGKCTTPAEKENLKDKWGILTKNLNSVDGPRKSREKWMKTWADIKSTSKKKGRQFLARSKIVNGPVIPPISAFESRVLALIEEIAPTGLDLNQIGLGNSLTEPAFAMAFVTAPDDPLEGNSAMHRFLPESPLVKEEQEEIEEEKHEQQQKQQHEQEQQQQQKSASDSGSYNATSPMPQRKKRKIGNEMYKMNAESLAAQNRLVDVVANIANSIARIADSLSQMVPVQQLTLDTMKEVLQELRNNY